jgi:hypothetical protein
MGGQVSSSAALSPGQIDSVSCASAGNCSAVGYYTVDYTTYGFVVTEKHGAWGAAMAVPTPG